MHCKANFCYYNYLSFSFYLDIFQETAAQEEKQMH